MFVKITHVAGQSPVVPCHMIPSRHIYMNLIPQIGHTIITIRKYDVDSTAATYFSIKSTVPVSENHQMPAKKTQIWSLVAIFLPFKAFLTQDSPMAYL